MTKSIFSLVFISSYIITTCFGWDYPPFWNETILLEDLPTDKTTGATIINPWDYNQRLGAMKSLIFETTKQSPCLYKNDVKENVLWGLALQLGWQLESGRLMTDDRSQMTAKSWWANMNYQLFLVPLLGASAAGYPNVPTNLQVLAPHQTDGTVFCRSSQLPAQTEACKQIEQALIDWRDFFAGSPKAEQNCTVNGQEDALDHLLGNMWKAHTSSLEHGMEVPFVKKSLENFSTQEGNFGVGWAGLVRFIAATHFYTDFNYTNAQQVFLPPRMFVKGDVLPFVKDMPSKTNEATLAIETLSKANKVSGGTILKIWSRAMCSKKGRLDGRYLVNNGLYDFSAFLSSYKIIIDLARTCDY